MTARITSRVDSTKVRVEPCTGFRPGMVLVFRGSNGDRAGTAYVEEVDELHSELTFLIPLNAMVPAVAEGDEVRELERPCTRCTCNRCESERAAAGCGDCAELRRAIALSEAYRVTSEICSSCGMPATFVQPDGPRISYRCDECPAKPPDECGNAERELPGAPAVRKLMAIAQAQ